MREPLKLLTTTRNIVTISLFADGFHGMEDSVILYIEPASGLSRLWNAVDELKWARAPATVK